MASLISSILVALVIASFFLGQRKAAALAGRAGFLAAFASVLSWDFCWPRSTCCRCWSIFVSALRLPSATSNRPGSPPSIPRLPTICSEAHCLRDVQMLVHGSYSGDAGAGARSRRQSLRVGAESGQLASAHCRRGSRCIGSAFYAYQPHSPGVSRPQPLRAHRQVAAARLLGGRRSDHHRHRLLGAVRDPALLRARSRRSTSCSACTGRRRPRYAPIRSVPPAPSASCRWSPARC